MFCQIDEITFESINSPSAFSERESTKFAQQPRLGKKDKIIMTGEDLRGLRISLTLKYSDKANPRKPEDALSKLRQLRKKGEPVSFVLANGRLVGRYVIESIDYNPVKVTPQGDFITVDVSLSLLEYKNEYKREWDQSKWSKV